MSEVKPPSAPPAGETRRYRSPRREAQARATRDAVIKAAQTRFAEVGYAGTTIDSVATDADVSAATVYATFGSKRALFEAAVDQAVVGDTESLALADRQWVQELARIDDRAERMRYLYRSLREVYERTAALDRAIEDAARHDPELRELLDDHRRRQQEDSARFRAAVIGEGRVFPELTDAQDVEALWALGGQAVYRLLTVDCGWSPETWERWMLGMMTRLLASPPASEAP
jgi:AcrR family transcriptional regulator